MRVGPLKFRLQLACGESFAIGPGKADLLEAIDHEGSITGAGRALGMSYRRAWLLVDEMNRCFREKVVETLSGGGRERGARLTALGHEMLRAYRALQREAAQLATTDACETLSAAILDAPRPATAIPKAD